ncbi:MAG: LPS-assembly protein LptD [Candidatus Methylomirabilia bacterium]
MTIQADRIEQVGEDGLLICTGSVEITQGESRLSADRVEINRQTGETVALGQPVFMDAQDRLVGDRIEYNFKSQTGVVYNGSAFVDPFYRLSGERMDRIGQRIYEVRRGVFTTCEADPPAWSFRVGKATADLDGSIEGWNASFWVKRLPLIPWFPYFTAPITRERKTGFLFPTAGSSDRRGFFASVPFFWAISDSQDLTVAPHAFSDLGLGGSGEYRYVLSESSRGAAGGFYVREIYEDDDDRGSYFVKHDWRISPTTLFTADIDGVSDDDFFRTYGDVLGERSLQRVESNLFLTRRWTSWNLVGNAFWYQDLTTGSAVELQRLPALSLVGVRQPVPGVPRLLYELDSSFVNFVRDVGSDGLRGDLRPRIFLPLSPGGLFTVTPFIGGRATAYDRTVVGERITGDGITVEVTEDDPRVRLLGEAGADAEARASRVFDAGGVGGIASLQHVIEPRVNYTAIDGFDKDKLPQYDVGGIDRGVVNPTGLPQATLGIDRIPATSQLTYSLTNRLNAKTVAGPGQESVRWELARFALTQTYDLLADERPLSDLRGELIVEPNRFFRFRGDASYDVYGDGLQTANADVTATFRDVSATVGTRFSDPDKIEFLRGQLRATVFRYLDFRVESHYDIRSGTVVENRFGLTLNCQCWNLAVEYIDREENDDEIRFKVNLLGVGEVLKTALR